MVKQEIWLHRNFSVRYPPNETGGVSELLLFLYLAEEAMMGKYEELKKTQHF
jgi:hypothetical protein